MGWGTYSVENRLSSDRHAFYNDSSTSYDQIFEQKKKQEAHETMLPKNALLREARDSENHPESFPVIIALDVTGSMLHIPEMFIKNGMPKMIQRIIEAGCVDPAILFLAIGDHTYDKFPLQVGQFESGDEELDTWLTRVYPEGGGGGNSGESYLLAWYYGAFHTITDAWEKRKQKGLIITIGDEPCLRGIDQVSLEVMFGSKVSERGYTAEDLIKLASEKYNLVHFHITETPTGMGYSGFKNPLNLLGESFYEISNHEHLPERIANACINFCKYPNVQKDNPTEETPTEEIL